MQVRVLNGAKGMVVIEYSRKSHNSAGFIDSEHPSTTVNSKTVFTDIVKNDEPATGQQTH